jgi:heat shock protein HtpX
MYVLGEKNMNGVKTAFLMTLIMILFLLVGEALGGQQGLILAFVLSLGMNFFAYWFSDKLVLKAYRAREVSKEQAPKLYGIIEKLVKNSNMPMPKVYVIPSATPNAFATGRNPKTGAVAVTEGIVRLLNDDELEGVLAHELAHIQNRDILLSTIVATMVGTITFLARMAGFALFFFGGRDQGRDTGSALTQILLIILAPIAAMIIQLAISRAREYMADAGGARISGKPLGLAGALKKLESGVSRVPMNEANPSTAHMFIVHPFKGGGLMKLFSTHPPIPERVKRLEALAQGRA